MGAVVLSLAALCGARTQAQGDPPRAFDAATAPVRSPGTTVRIDLIGDSTQTNNAGYGRGFCANVTAQVDCGAGDGSRDDVCGEYPAVHPGCTCDRSGTGGSHVAVAKEL